MRAGADLPAPEGRALVLVLGILMDPGAERGFVREFAVVTAEITP